MSSSWLHPSPSCSAHESLGLKLYIQRVLSMIPEGLLPPYLGDSCVACPRPTAPIFCELFQQTRFSTRLKNVMFSNPRAMKK